MGAQLITRCIFVDGSLLTLFVASILVITLYINPRHCGLSDYPQDVRAAVPPRTRKELLLGILIALVLLPVLVAVPLYSTYWIKQQQSGTISYWTALLTVFGEYSLVSLFDLVVLDILMFHTWTPKFVVIPGTAGMPGYKDWRRHARAQLTVGSLLIGADFGDPCVVPTYLY